jgi:hypothetical protein
MHSFKDSAGREWQLSVTAWTLKDVRDKTGILLTTLVEESCQLLIELHRDPVLLADILWVMVEEQAESKSITVRQFAEAFGGDSVSEARNALIEATIDFFDDQETRAGTREVLRKMTTIAETMRTGAIEKIANLDCDSAAKIILDSYSNSPVFAE